VCDKFVGTLKGRWGEQVGKGEKKRAGKTFVNKSFPKPFQKTLTGEQILREVFEILISA